MVDSAVPLLAAPSSARRLRPLTEYFEAHVEILTSSNHFGKKNDGLGLFGNSVSGRKCPSLTPVLTL